MTYLSQSREGHVAPGEVTIMASCGGWRWSELNWQSSTASLGLFLSSTLLERRSSRLQTDLQSGQIPVLCAPGCMGLIVWEREASTVAGWS